MSTNSEQKEQADKLIGLVKTAIDQDVGLREKYQIGDKFRFVRDRLQALLEMLETNLKTVSAEITATASNEIKPNEVIVYVYLYNAQGRVLQTWQPMLTPRALYEYSINRPIYADKSHIEALLRSKVDQAQHAYLTVVIKREDITQPAEGESAIKIKEGALQFERLVDFIHNGECFRLNAEKELVKR